ncbi:unnamed protein product [Pedinophyceae sp. YPF-701]|nr:unnamed protein product [Pedinophyceae sp. YPF-701]
MPFGDYRFNGGLRPEGSPSPDEHHKWARNLAEWHGMSEYYKLAKRDVLKHGILNYWDIEMALTSPEKVIDRIIRGVEKSSLVSGLFLAGTMKLLIQPPAVIAALSSSSGWRNLFLIALSAAVILHVMVIGHGFVFVYALCSCQREVDWMFFLRKYGFMTSMVYSLHATGNLLIALALGTAMTQAYEEAAGIVFIVFAMILCGVVPLALSVPLQNAAGGVRTDKTTSSKLSVYILEYYLRPLAEDDEKYAAKNMRDALLKVGQNEPDLMRLCTETAVA